MPDTSAAAPAGEDTTTAGDWSSPEMTLVSTMRTGHPVRGFDVMRSSAPELAGALRVERLDAQTQGAW